MITKSQKSAPAKASHLCTDLTNGRGGVNLEKVFHDYAHPNAAGHQLIADEVYEELEKLGFLK